MNIIKSIFSLLSGLVLARGLGASEYGRYAFLLGSFNAVSQLIDMGTSSAFYTLLARRKRRRTFFIHYGGWLGIQFFLPLIAVAVMFPDRLISAIWLGNQRWIVVLSWWAAFVSRQLWPAVVQTGEANRETTVAQAGGASLALIHFLVVCLLYYFHRLTIPQVMGFLGCEYLIISIYLGWRFVQSGEEADGIEETPWKKEFFSFWRPLVIFSWVGFTYSFADTWLLQRFGGGAEQGYFALSAQFAAICQLGTGAVINVFWKEVAAASQIQNIGKIQRIYKTAAEGLYFITVFGVCVLWPHVPRILNWTAGSDFHGALPCMFLMLLTPVHQSLGQIHGAMFFGMGETRLYGKIGTAMMLLSLPITYFVLASPSMNWPGFGMGSLGLALKIVILQILTVNLQMICLSKKHSILSMGHFLAMQIRAPLALGTLATLLWGIQRLPFFSASINNGLGHMIFFSLLFGTTVGGFLFWRPAWVGISEESVRSMTGEWRRRAWIKAKKLV